MSHLKIRTTTLKFTINPYIYLRIVHIYYTLQDNSDKFNCRLTGAQDILLFYNFLPDKCLRTKPNLHRNSCLRIENLNSEIIDASKKIILKKNEQSNFSNVDELMKSNENLKIAVSDLKSQLDEQNRKLDMILKKLQHK